MAATTEFDPGHDLHAAVRDYFAMLEAELRDRGPSRRGPSHFLQRSDDDRAALERRFQAIGAILIEHGLPYLTRFRPRWGYTSATLHAVEQYLQNHVGILRLMETDVYRQAAEVPTLAGRSLDDIFRAAPHPGDIPGRPRHHEGAPLLAGVEYLGREQRNRSLALAGEAFVIALERQRLADAGCEVYADNIEHVSGDYGEGLGYDIHSYEIDGRDRFIEVKTTRFRKETPFYVSANEVAVSSRHRERFWVYRVYNFRERPFVYCLNGSLAERFRLEPQEYRARIR